MEQIGASKVEVEESLVRHMILNTIRNYVRKYKNIYGPEIVIACDSKNFWRRDLFPYYKSSRKKNRESSGHDWPAIFECLNKVKEELKQYSPYKVVEAETCEADDIIAILTQKHSATQKVMIVSGDSDFIQLQRYPNVEQFSPVLKKEIKESEPLSQLKQKIIRGDRGDGVPNILSPDDIFVSGGRQKPITEVKITKWLLEDPRDFCDDTMLRNYNRNELLIDLSKIPQDKKLNILEQYESAHSKTKQVFMNYLIANRLKNLIEVLDEF